MGFDVSMMLCMAAGAEVGENILFVCSIVKNIVLSDLFRWAIRNKSTARMSENLED